MIAAGRLTKAWPLANPIWLTAMVEVMPKFDINGVVRESAFLAQIVHECAVFTRFEENLNYKDPARIALIFRSAFDLDKNKAISADEIEFAKAYARQPEKLANRAYANRYGNGDETSGDGWKYRGRGPLQTTFKKNYEIASFWTGVNLVLTPDELLVPRHGCAPACGYWKDHGCNQLADVGDHDQITRLINAGMAGLEERKAMVPVIRKILEA